MFLLQDVVAMKYIQGSTYGQLVKTKVQVLVKVIFLLHVNYNLDMSEIWLSNMQYNTIPHRCRLFGIIALIWCTRCWISMKFDLTRLHFVFKNKNCLHLKCVSVHSYISVQGRYGFWPYEPTWSHISLVGGYIMPAISEANSGQVCDTKCDEDV